MKLHQLIHDQIRPGASVENISYDMEAVNGQILDQTAQGDNKLVPDLNIDDGADDLAVIYFLFFPL